MTAILLADLPQEELHAGDRITVIGWVAVGSTVAAVYLRPDGSVPLLPLPADALRVELT